MPKYTVVVQETIQHSVEVEAVSKEQAGLLGYDAVMNATMDYETESLGTNSIDIYEEN